MLKAATRMRSSVVRLAVGYCSICKAAFRRLRCCPRLRSFALLPSSSKHFSSRNCRSSKKWTLFEGRGSSLQATKIRARGAPAVRVVILQHRRRIRPGAGTAGHNFIGKQPPGAREAHRYAFPGLGAGRRQGSPRSHSPLQPEKESPRVPICAAPGARRCRGGRDGSTTMISTSEYRYHKRRQRGGFTGYTYTSHRYLLIERFPFFINPPWTLGSLLLRIIIIIICNLHRANGVGANGR